MQSSETAQTTSLPNGAHPISSEVTLDQAIEKSKAEIHDAQTEEVRKGKRYQKKHPDKNLGRPPKSQPSPSLDRVEPPQTASFDATPYLKQAVQAPFAIAAVKLKCDEIKVSDDEATPVAIAADQVLRAYAPDLEKADPKKAAVIALAISFSMLAFQKYSVYQAKVEKPATPPPSNEAAKATPQSPTEPGAAASAPVLIRGGVPASEAFRSPNRFNG